MEPDRPTSAWSPESQAPLLAAAEHLKAGRYEQVADCLQKAHLASERRGEAIATIILLLARRICLDCCECHAEIRRHNQACDEAKQRERELRQELATLLALMSGQGAANLESIRTGLVGEIAARPGMLKLAEPRSLWQQIKSLVRREPLTQLPEPELLTAPVEEPTPIPTEKVESPAGPHPIAEDNATTISPLEKEQRGEHVAPALAVYCLGPFRAFQNDQPISEWSSLKAKSVCKYLLANPEARISRDVLMDIFWPDATAKAARRNLHQAIYSLRQVLRGEQPDFQHVQFEDDCYFLNPRMDVWVDFKEFERHVHTGQRLEAAGRRKKAMAAYGVAEDLYLDDFMSEDLYEDWTQPQRRYLRDTYLDITDRLAKYYLQEGEYMTATALCHKLLAKDSCHEGAHRHLMQCYQALGQRHLAVRQYQNCVQALKQELDLSPSQQTHLLYHRITTTK